MRTALLGGAPSGETCVRLVGVGTQIRNAEMPENGDITKLERQRISCSLDRFSADERLLYIKNLYAVSPILDRGHQAVAAEYRERFRAAVEVDGVCWLFGWRLVGFAAADEQPDDDYDPIRSADLEWLHPAFDDFVVKLELGDEPVLRVSGDEGQTWRCVEVAELCDVLGDWLEARRAA